MNLTNPRLIRSVLEQNGFRFSKARGQNFLVDPAVPEKIASLVDSSMGVVEIGPGFGALTAALCGRAGVVAAIEVDRRLMPVLRENLAGFENLELIEADALKTDLDALAERLFSGLTPVVAANLPYSITTDILTKLVESKSYPTMALMLQSEVAQRICASAGEKAYGAFGVFVNVFCQPSILFDVPPECFMPRPGVNSSVLRLERRKEALVPEDERKMFFHVVKGAFAQRRKTLKNALSSVFPLEASEVEAALRAAGTDPSLRGETLDISRFLYIAKEIEMRLRRQ